jgi:methylenetetrahydrofolate reductase (NADPH)
MPLNAYKGFKNMTGFCKTRVPPDMREQVEKYKDDAEGFTAWGVEYITSLCRKLVRDKLVPGLHFYCLNQSARSYQILEKLGYLRPLNWLDQYGLNSSL